MNIKSWMNWSSKTVNISRHFSRHCFIDILFSKPTMLLCCNKSLWSLVETPSFFVVVHSKSLIHFSKFKTYSFSEWHWQLYSSKMDFKKFLRSKIGILKIATIVSIGIRFMNMYISWKTLIFKMNTYYHIKRYSHLWRWSQPGLQWLW